MKNLISKKKVLDFAAGIIDEKIKRVEGILMELEEGITNESKSSAGDKHETARAMIHLEQEKNQSILASLQNQKKGLQQIYQTEKFTKVKKGAMIEAGDLILMVGIGLGPVKIQNKEVIFVSEQAALAKELMGKSVKEQFEFQGQKQVISAIS